MIDLDALLHRADRLLSLIVTGKADEEAARELVRVLERLHGTAQERPSDAHGGSKSR